MINYFAFILNIVLICKIAYSILKYFQDCAYEANLKRYLFFYYCKLFFMNFILFFIFLYFMFQEKIYITVFYIIWQLYVIHRFDSIKYLSEIKYSKRMWRLISISIIIILTCFIIISYYINYLNSSLIIIYLAPFILYLALLISKPIELILVQKYHKKAMLKLKEYKPIIIGITGSAGKTSIKNYLYELLKDKYITYKTPKSYNTINGIDMTINNDLISYNAILILEMGASKKNDIKKLKRIYNPTFSIISDVFYQHLSSFKTIENIINEKMQLLTCNTAIINCNNSYIKSYPRPKDNNIITYGNENSNDYYYTNLEHSIDGISFDLYEKGIKYSHIKTKLRGVHNVCNLIACIILAIKFDIPKEDIIRKVNNLENYEHRLSIKKHNNLTIIDDSYNSNVSGFKNALLLLNDVRDKKILLTPGIVEMGKMNKKISFELALEIKKICDKVILVKNPNSKNLYQSLISLEFNNITLVNSFKEGFESVKEGTLLIENDIPDNYFI